MSAAKVNLQAQVDTERTAAADAAKRFNTNLEEMAADMETLREELTKTKTERAQAQADVTRLTTELEAAADEAEEEEQRLKAKMAQLGMDLDEALEAGREKDTKIEKLEADLAEALKPPTPPPLPDFSNAKLLAADNQAKSGKLDMQSLLSNKDKLKKAAPVERPKFEGAQDSLEGVLFSSMQGRFAAIQGADDVEDLGDDDDWE